ncbi:MAG TPA: hypothetical protein VFN77_04985, partial [Acetobacteraceae bacterium]|nr:hypothetical protein [Acetobacteraceae bacterium]
HAFAPLCAGGPVLRAARARLLDRVRALGFRPRTLTGISLLIEGKPMLRLPGPAARPRFALPGRHGGRAIIRSARFIPAEFEADSADERPLGIALSAVAVGGEEMPLDRLIAGGFYPRAAYDAARWTDGAGELRIEAGACSLTLHVAALPRVWEKPAAPA